MTITRKEIETMRVNLLKDMNTYILNMGDEDIWEHWIMIVPDEADEDDFLSIAEDDELWSDTCYTFGKLTEEER